MEENKQHIRPTREGLIQEIEQRVADKILELKNAQLLIKLITKADTDDEAIEIAKMGTIYKKTGFHFDPRLENKGNTIKYFKKNEALSFRNDDGKPTHKLIVGDNYDALQNLLIQYRGMIDVIYIDPPYGKDSMGDFAKTNYQNAISRDNLLSMLHARLYLAKQLLSTEGVVLCSIDDKNYAYIKCLFDEIFGEKNFIATFIWHSEGHTDNQEPITCVHEYILCYRNKDNCFINNVVDPNVKNDSKILRDYAENSITKNGAKNPPLPITLPVGFPCEAKDLMMKKQANFLTIKSEIETIGYITKLKFPTPPEAAENGI